jgi:hypothetical protein
LGAGALDATEAVHAPAPNGRHDTHHRELFLINSIRTLNYDPLTSFEPVCLLTRMLTRK